MKIAVKPKIEDTAQLNMRVPVSTRQRVDSMRTLADQASVDYNATLVGMLDQFNDELEPRLHEIINQAQGRSNSASTSLAQPPMEQPTPGLTTNGRKLIN